eukprot:6074859-Prymnesium_polylepis.1
MSRHHERWPISWRSLRQRTGDRKQRLPQSRQSLPYVQSEYSEPGPPSSHTESLACAQVSEQHPVIARISHVAESPSGGGGGGDGASPMGPGAMCLAMRLACSASTHLSSSS